MVDMGLDPLPDVADRLYEAYVNVTADTFLNVDDENAIMDAYNELRLLRSIVCNLTGGKPMGDGMVPLRRSAYGYIRYHDRRKIDVIHRAYEAEI